MDASNKHQVTRLVEKPIVERLDVEINDSVNISDTLVSLKSGGASPKVVVIDGRDNQEEWLREDLELLFEAIGMMQPESIELKNLGVGTECLFHMRLLTIVLNSSTHLKRLEVFNADMEGDVFEVYELSKAIKNHASLEVFRLELFDVADDSIPSGTLDPIVEALSLAPRMRDVSIGTFSDVNLITYVSSQALKELCQSNTLEKLEVYYVNDSMLVCIAEALETNETLKVLVVNQRNFDMMKSDSASALAKMLENNSTLETLELDPDRNEATDILAFVTRALTVNSTLRVLGLYGIKQISNECQHSFAKMLESNCSLETVRFLRESQEQFRLFDDEQRVSLSRRSSFFLTLNRQGRRHLKHNFENISRRQWVDRLLGAKDDVSCVFHFLQMNPLVCKAGQAGRNEEA